MKGGKTPLGYTVLEVMIVLAISGVMFIIAQNFVNGKQARTAFTQGVNELSSQLQNTADQVGDGQFSDIQMPTCQVNTASYVTFPTAAPTREQGTNTSCVFLGKLVYFFAAAPGYPQKYSQFVMAGAMKNPSNDKPFADLNDYRNYISAVSNTAIQLTTINDVPQTLDITRMRITPQTGPAVTNYSLGFIQGLGITNASAGPSDPHPASYKSGSQTIAMVYSDALTDGNQNGTADNFNTVANNKVNRRIYYATQAEICVSDGAQRAVIRVNIQNRGLNVDTIRPDSGEETWCVVS